MAPISFKLVKVQTEQFAILDKKLPPIDEAEFELSFNVAFGANSEKRLLACFVSIDYLFESDVFILLKLRTQFEIESASWQKLLKVKPSKITLPKALMQHLATITVGTARGILHAKTEGTAYNHFLLPTINLEEVIKQDEELEL